MPVKSVMFIHTDDLQNHPHDIGILLLCHTDHILAYPYDVICRPKVMALFVRTWNSMS